VGFFFLLSFPFFHACVLLNLFISSSVLLFFVLGCWT